jgi:tRNA 2-selenouridine synthase
MIRLAPDKFLQMAEYTAIIDVRSPAEFAGGHLPGAFNIPLFNDQERAVVGTLYKQTGQEETILKGLEIAGPKLSGFVKTAKDIAGDKHILVYCWRGGLRSRNMAWLYELAGFKVYVLDGGYKAYRKYIRNQLGVNVNLVILGGKTGSGKTEILDHIQSNGHQIINLEQIAHHKGSAFGDLGQENQPTNEQFENNLYQAMGNLDPDIITWVEDESMGIGRVSIPEPFFRMMRSTEVIFMDLPKSERIKRLVKEYAGFPKERLASGVTRIQKKLGGLNSKRALGALEKDDFYTVADILLFYYDKAYLKGLSMRNQETVSELKVKADNPSKNARIALSHYQEILAPKSQHVN